MKDLNSFVPESLFLDAKHEKSGRLCREDCAVLDADGYRVLAFRGAGLSVGQSFLNLYGVSDAEHRFLEQSLSTHRRILLNGKDGALIFHTDLLQATGTLLVLILQSPAQAVARALLLLGCNDFAYPSDLPSANCTGAADAELIDTLTELLYYTNRIFSYSSANGDSLGIWTRTLLIANLVGCKLDQATLPVEGPSLSESETQRLTAFLLCTLLSLRGNADKICAEGICDPFSPRKDLHVSIKAIPLSHCGTSSTNTKQPPPPSQGTRFPFLSLPAFRNFSATVTERRLILETILHQSNDHTPELHTDIPLHFCLRIEFF